MAGTHGSKLKWSNGPMLEDTKVKISKARKNKPSNNKLGINGTSSGKIPKGYKRKQKLIWINNGIKLTRIPESTNIPIGWLKGKNIRSSGAGSAT